MNLRVRNAFGLDGAAVDFSVTRGRIVSSDTAPPDTIEIDGRGGTVLPGLHDHHIHLLATAAQRASLDLSRCTSANEVAVAMRAAVSEGSIRAVDYDERAVGLLDRNILDSWVAETPVRVLDRTGALWVLNSAALRLLGEAELPPGAECDAGGRSNGRFWREDAWLGARLGKTEPPLDCLGHELAMYGITGVTDTGWRNGPAEARTLGAAHLRGDLPQTLTLMGSEGMTTGAGYSRGSLKLMIDERDPPAIELLAKRIEGAREAGRGVAAHCVTATELALYLAALDATGGARAGDRIEHGGTISAEAIDAIAASPLTVVTNPAFIHDRGDRYRAEIPEREHDELYRARSLCAAGIPLAAGSDSPYASADPWLAMRTARDRCTRAGERLGPGERLSAERALALYLGRAGEPGGQVRTLKVGQPADFVICLGCPREVLAELTAERVALTVIGGAIAFSRA